MYVITDMLYTLQGDGRRKGVPEPSPAQVKAETFKKQIRENDAEFLDEYMEFGREKADKNVDRMLNIVRQKLIKACGKSKVLVGSTLMKSPRR